MTVSSKRSFRKREASVLLFNTWQREWLRVLSKVSTETSRKARSAAPWHGCCFQHKNIPRCWELRRPRATPQKRAGKKTVQKQRFRHGADTCEPSGTCGACLNGDGGVQVWTGALRFHHCKGAGGLLLTAPRLLLLPPRMASTVSRRYSWGWSEGRRERDGRARQAWECGDASFPCLLE